MLTAEEINARTPMEEVADLLPGDFLRRETDTFFYDAMIGSKDDVLRMLQGRSQSLLDEAYLQCKTFQSA